MGALTVSDPHGDSNFEYTMDTAITYWCFSMENHNLRSRRCGNINCLLKINKVTIGAIAYCSFTTHCTHSLRISALWEAEGGVPLMPSLNKIVDRVSIFRGVYSTYLSFLIGAGRTELPSGSKSCP